MRDPLKRVGAGVLVLTVLACVTSALAADTLDFKLSRDLETARHNTTGFVFPLTWFAPDRMPEGVAALQAGQVYNHAPETVVGCEAVVSMPTSTISHGAGEIFAGVCVIEVDGHRQRAAICHDAMIGDSAIRPLTGAASPAADRRAAAILMLDACFGT